MKSGPGAYDVFSAEEAAAELFAEFPELKKNTLIFTSRADVEAHKADIARLPQSEFNDPNDQIDTAMASGRPKVLRFGQRVKDGFVNHFGNVIVLVTEGIMADVEAFQCSGKLSIAEKQKAGAHWLWACLDHEAGHILTWQGIAKFFRKSDQLGECMADAYSMIRHYQRFGADSAFPETFSELRLHRTLTLNSTNNMDHSTTRAIDEVVRLNKEGKIAGLSPEESRKLAVVIGFKVAFTADEKYSLSSAFNNKALKAGLAEADADARVETLAEIGLKTKSPVVHDSVLSYLKSYPQIMEGLAFDKAALQNSIAALESARPSGAEPLRPLWHRVATKIFGGAKKPPERSHLLLAP